jgi:hypothetical protein
MRRSSSNAVFPPNIRISKQTKVSALSAGIAKEAEGFEGFKPEAREPHVVSRSVVTKTDNKYKEAEQDEGADDKSMKHLGTHEKNDAIMCQSCKNFKIPDLDPGSA